MLRSGLLARFTSAGLTGSTLAPQDQVRASLAALGLALVGFLAFGVAMWSQLTVGWQWSAPDASATTTAMIVMSGAVVGFLTLALLSGIPVAWAVGRAVVRREARDLLAPMLLAAAGVTALVLGSRHFGHGWPGTGGHPWADRGLVPRAVASWS